MSVEIKSETIDVKGQSVILVSVRGGENAIGTFSIGSNSRDGVLGTETRLLYIGTDPIINMTCSSGASKKSDKLMSFSPGFHGYDQKVFDVLTSAFLSLNRGDSLTAGLKGIFSLLQDGVYAVYTSDYYPTDGNGTFFWGAYNTNHEVHGTAEHNRITMSGNVYKPCFLIPTQSMGYFTARALASTEEFVKKRRIHGIVYHVSGFHSALLKGHHGAVACTKENIPYKCAVIEKISDPYTEKIAPVQMVENQEEENGENQSAPVPPTPVPVEREGITGFRSPSIKIPIEAFPKDMLNIIVNGLSEYKPPHFEVITAKLDSVRKKAVTNNIFSNEVLEKAEQMPDAGMVESAYAISSLSDEELNRLLAGDVEFNGKVIISPNFYSSIVTACNFLQFTDMKRFIDFSIAIMDNPDLSATHEYVAQRVLSQEKNTKLYNFFKSAAASGDAKYEKILPAANTFLKRYEADNRR